MVKMNFIGILENQEHRLIVDDHDKEDGLYTIILNGKSYSVDAHTMPSLIVSALIDGKSYDLDVDDKDQTKDPLDGKMSIRVRGRVIRLEMLEERRKKMKDAQMSVFSHHEQREIKAPMPGKVLRCLVSVNEAVKKGQGLVVMEAMKMENELSSPKDGFVKAILCKEGSAVENQATLLVIE